MTSIKHAIVLLCGAIALQVHGPLMAAGSAAKAAASPAAVQILKVRPDVYMLTVGGINIAVETGPDGVIVVDTGPAAHAEALLAVIHQLSPTPIRYVVATNPEPDLIGGMGRLAAAGQSLVSSSKGGTAPIIARTELLPHLIEKQPGEATLPGETFSRPQYNFYMNGQGIAVMWQPAAVSDADLAVRFWSSDVLVTGAVLDMTRFPVIDIEHGGSLAGEIDAINRLLNTQVIAPIPVVMNNAGTMVIPIRGPLADQADLVTYRDMLQDMQRRIEYLIDQHLSLEQIHKSDPAAGYRTRFGADTGDWTTRQFIDAAYQSILNERKAKEAECAKK